MPKRIGHLYESYMTQENFIKAEKLIGKNKPDNQKARHISQNAERYGKELYEQCLRGEYHFHKSRERDIVDNYKGKTRHLKIPCLADQAVQQAWLNIAVPIIMRHNYHYNCGSIPGGGQSRAINAVKRWCRNPKNKYAAVTDIRKFYDTCPHSLVLDGLRRMIKDEKFIQVAADILKSMSDDGVGLAIGHPTSHWLANVALMHIDNEMKRRYVKVKFTRYMDDIVMVSPNKRALNKCVQWLKTSITEVRMKLKKWQVFAIDDRGISFLSYRFFHRFTIITKRLMVRISRRFAKSSEHMTAHIAQALVSYLGIIKHCNSINFKRQWVFPVVNPKHLRRLISNHDKSLLRRTAGRDRNPIDSYAGSSVYS